MPVVSGYAWYLAVLCSSGYQQDCLASCHLTVQAHFGDAQRAVVWVCRLLIERFGYQNTFLLTAGLKLIAYLPLLPLLAFVDDGIFRLRSLQQQPADATDLEEPLLSS